MAGRAFWAACGVTGVVVLVGCALPLARLGLRGGDLNAHETVRMLTLGTGGPIAVLAAGVVLLGSAVAGLRFGAGGTAVVLALVAALVAFSQAEQAAAYTTADGGILCTAYQATEGVDCGGPIYGPELADLYAGHAPVPRTVEEQAEEVAYTAEPRPGLWLLLLAPVPLVFWSGYRAARLRIRSVAVAVAVVIVVGALVTLLTLAHLVFANYSG